MKRYNILNTIICILFAHTIFGQSVTFTNPTHFSTCNNGDFQIHINNNTASALEALVIQLDFPCEIEYVSNSISGATEDNISNLTQPSFTMPDIPAGSSVTLSYTAHAPCAVSACVDAGQLFAYSVDLDHAGGQLHNISSGEFDMETSLLVFTQVDAPVLSGVKGQTILRKFTVSNTRPGPIKIFTFTDTHNPGLVIQSNDGTVISTGPSELVLSFDGDDFMSVGDGDELFEQGEELIVTEMILIDICGQEPITALSDINVGWGCDAQICQSFDFKAIVNVLMNTDIGSILAFDSVVVEPTCYCSPDPLTQSLTISNLSTFNDASNINIEFNPLPSGQYFLESNVKMVHDGDTTELVTSFEDESETTCIPTTSYSAMSFTIPSILANESITILWDLEVCSAGECTSAGVNWSYSGNYYKDCTLPSDTYHVFSNAVENISLVQGAIESQPLVDGETQTIKYHASSIFLDSLDGTMNLSISLPCGATIQNPVDWLFAGVTASNVDISADGDLTIIDLAYPLPMPDTFGFVEIPILFTKDTLCYPNITVQKDSLFSSCSFICVGEAGCEKTSLSASITADVILDFNDGCTDCNLQYCNSKLTTFEVPIEGYCIDTVAGYASYNFDIFRTTYGLPDNDDDHQPDFSGDLDFSSIRRDHAVYGDSLHAAIEGIIVTDLPNTSFSNGYVEIRVTSYTSVGIQANLKPIELPQLLNPNTGFNNLGTTLRIFDKSENQYYFCPAIPNGEEPELVGTTLVYYYDISPDTLGGNVPVNYQYEQGDSILVEADYRIDYNFSNGASFGYFSLTVAPTIFLSTTPNPPKKDLFACACKESIIDVANINYATQGGFSSTVDICQGETDDGGLIFPFIYGTFSNFFPFEYRRTAILDQLKLPKIEGLELKESFIEFATSNSQYILDYPDSTVVNYSSIETNHIPYPDEDQEGYYIYDLSDFPDMFWDDNVFTRMRFNYKNLGCKFSGNINYAGLLSSELLPQNNFLNSKEEKTTSFRITGLVPSLNLDIKLCDKLVLSDSISWEFSISNVLNQNCPNNAVTDAPNVWFLPMATNGLADNFQLFNRITGQEIPSQNGIFQLDSLMQCDSIHLLLTGSNHACGPADIFFNYGWSCSPYTDPIETPCVALAQTCQVTSPPGVIDLIPDTVALSAELCEELPYSYIEVFDAGLGAVYDLIVNAQLPPGLVINPGTSEMEWPVGSGNFMVVADPTDQGNGLFNWNVTDVLDPLNHKLQGINSAPANGVTIRFKTLTTCDFISGSFILYTASAKKVCGLQTNTIARIGTPINISSVTAPYTTAMTIGSDGQPGCSDTISMDVNLSFSDTTGSQDGLFAQLPLNATYVPGSCTGSLPNCAPTISGNELSWILPQGINTANLSFKIIGFLDQDCQTVAIPFYATTQENAFCVGSSQNCNIKIQTGAQVATINIEKPVFTISSFHATPLPGNTQLVDLTADIENVGILNTIPITAKLYLDHDHNGSLSTGDEFIQAYSFDEYLNNGDATSLNIFAQAIPTNDICKLMIVIGEPENCVCATTTLTLQAPIIFTNTSVDTICSGESISIGRPAVNGHAYQWEDANGIDCLNCAETNFSQENETFNPITYTLILKDNATCLTSFEYIVTVLPKLKIWSADESVCQGDIATLVASDGSSFMWQGEGITDPNQQIQMVSPMSSGFYIVNISDDFGCSSLDSAFVTVLENPIADAGENISVCHGVTAQLDATVDAGLDITWTPGTPSLDNPNIADPTVLIDQNTTFTMTVSNGICMASDEVDVSFFDGVNLTISPDVALCAGDTATIMVSGADTYSWEPFIAGMCQNADCSTIQVIPMTNLHLTVKGITNDGCTDTTGVNITIIEDTLWTNSNLEICSGSSVILFGNTITEQGTYCDTIEHALGCYEIKCIDVQLLDSITVMDSAQICTGENFLFNGQALSETGTYCVDTLSVDGCDSSYCLFLDVLPSPSFTINPLDASIKVGDSIPLEIIGNNIDVVWLPNQSLSCLTCLDPVASPLETTWYYATVTDENGCQNLDSILVKVKSLCELEVEIPNAFTPNTDGNNDLFRVANLSPNIGDIQISVFSRWGTKVFSGKNNNGWDGQFNGQVLPAEVYAYLIVLDCPDGEQKIFKGNITLLR